MPLRGNTVQDSFQNVVPTAIQNSFIEGLKTEFTGLNFPPNAATDTSNCIFTMIGDVTRREGFDFEDNYSLISQDRTGKSIAEYRWLNAGGDGETQIYVLQVGNTISFYESSSATVANPLSTTKLSTTVDLTAFLVAGSSFDPSIAECQFSDGNGYLFVYHPYCDPFYCTFDNGNIGATRIDTQIRDFNGMPETGVLPTFRPITLSPEHTYNLQNQGWVNPPSWTANTNDAIGSVIANAIVPGHYAFIVSTGTQTFNVQSGISVSPGDAVNLTCSFSTNSQPDGSGSGIGGSVGGVGRVTSYSGTTMVIFIDSISYYDITEQYLINQTWNLTSSSDKALITTWQSAIGNYPSNADVWWRYKDSTDVFNPAATINSKTYPNSPAAQGHFILDAFNQQQSTVSAVSSLTPIVTSLRPRTGTWFSGRVWYAGVDGAQGDTGDQKYYTWTENIYFSQIIVTSDQFGRCYQTNDPTDENLFDLLPSDGGVIQIQGCGTVYKLFPIQNGMLVFAANGVWFITGSQGIGFAANDYTITKISNVESISSTSFVNVLGMPVFWNEEGIYNVTASQQGLGLTVSPLTLGTIRSFYNSIPIDSKKYARGAYNPITYVLQWTYRKTQESDITSRYQFDTILNLNINTKAFFPYSISNATGSPFIHGVTYIASPGGSSAPSPTFKYVTSVKNGASYNFTFSEENDDTHLDWFSNDNIGLDYSSYFVTGYQLDGQGLRKFQPEYIYMYSRNDTPSAYTIQGIWDFANSGDSGKYSSRQVININKPYFGMVFRRHRIRGHGVALQIKVSSVTGQPFDIMGWTQVATQNAGV